MNPFSNMTEYRNEYELVFGGDSFDQFASDFDDHSTPVFCEISQKNRCFLTKYSFKKFSLVKGASFQNSTNGHFSARGICCFSKIVNFYDH